MKHCYPMRSRIVAARQLGDETVIMCARNSTLFNLNPAATLIWQAADGHTTLASIVEQHICTAYEVNFEEALRDATEFVSDLAAHGVLLIADSPISNPHDFLEKAS